MYTLLLALIVSAAPRPAAEPPVFDVRPLDGQPVSGQLVGLDSKQVTLKTASASVSLETEKVTCIAAQNPPASTTQAKVWINLVDGSELAAQDYAVRAGVAKIVMAGGEALELPTGNIAGVRFQSPSEPMAAQWSRILPLAVGGDLLVTSKDDAMDYHKGVLHDVSDKQVQFEIEGDVLGVKRSKVFGLVYYHVAAAETPVAPYTILDAAGSRWAATSLKLAEKLEWTGPGGRTQRRDLAQIVQIDLSRGKIIYLNTLKPERAVYTPFFAAEKELPSRLELFRQRENQNLESKPLRIGGQTFSKGLWMHSKTELTYNLPGQFSRFEAVAGIDDDVRPRGNVRLVLRGDDKVLLEATIAGSEPPKTIRVDLAGVRRLVILADYGEEMDISDHLDLGNARLIK